MSTAITFSEYGGPEVLTLSEVATPEPGLGQVRIRVRAAAVNPIDVRIRAGLMQGAFPVNFPQVPGWEVAGVVEAVGGSSGFAVGDEVFGVASVGGYGEDVYKRQRSARPPTGRSSTSACSRGRRC